MERERWRGMTGHMPAAVADGYEETLLPSLAVSPY